MALTMTDSEFKAVLKQIRFAASERTEPMDFIQLKEFFGGCHVTPAQADMLWKYLDSHMIMVAHIDEDDPLFACVPETESDTSSSKVTAAQATPVNVQSQRQDVSNVAQDSTAIAKELIRRACQEEDSYDELAQLLDKYQMSTARKLASKVRPTEMHALVMYWGLDESGNRQGAQQIKEATGLSMNDVADAEKRAESCTPAIGRKSRRSLFDFLFNR